MPSPRYRVDVTAEAFRQLKKLDTPVRRRVAEAIDGLAADPRPASCTRLVGRTQRHLWRIRVGDYRVVYTVDDGERLVVVAVVGHRSTVYD